MNTLRIVSSIAVTWFAVSACSASLINKRVDDFDNPSGVPWVEEQPYELFTFVADAQSINAADDAEDIDVQQLYYGTASLTDKLNGVIIDEDRPKWETNYKADTFSDATLVMELHTGGSFKKLSLNETSGAKGAVDLVDAIVNSADAVDEKRLSRLETENKTLKAEAENDELIAAAAAAAIEDDAEDDDDDDAGAGGADGAADAGDGGS